MKMKIAVLVGIALCAMLLISPALANSANSNILEIYGNANEDDTIDMRDLTYVKLIFFGKKPETELADAKYDGKINPLDFIQIKLIIVDKEKELTIVDTAERTVTVSKPVERIVVLSTYSAEVMRMFREQDETVGVYEGVKEEEIYFPELSKLPSVGNAFEPDIEAILSLNPDLVFAWTYKSGQLIEKLPDSITVVSLHLYKPETLVEEIEKCGYILDKEDEARRYADDFHDRYIDLIKARTEGLAEEERPKMCVESDRGDYKVFSGDSGAQQMIDICGGRNIFAHLKGKSSFVVDAEEVAWRDPDIIIKHIGAADAGYEYDDPSKMEALRESVMNRPELANVAAVKKGTVYILDKDPIYGPDYPVAMAYWAKLIHPDIFVDLDPKAVHQEYLTEFLGFDYNVYEHGVFVYPPLEEWT